MAASFASASAQVSAALEALEKSVAVDDALEDCRGIAADGGGVRRHDEYRA